MKEKKKKTPHGLHSQIPHKLHVVKVATISQFQPKASKRRSDLGRMRRKDLIPAESRDKKPGCCGQTSERDMLYLSRRDTHHGEVKRKEVMGIYG